VRVSVAFLDLAAQAVDVHLQQMTLAKIFLTPDVLQQHILRHHTSGILSQIGEQTVLNRREVYLAIMLQDAMLAKVNRHITDRDRRPHGGCAIGCRELCAPDHRTHPREKFIHTEWLGQIIVRAEIQPTNLILVLATRGKDDDRHVRELAHPLTDSEAIQSWHHDIQENQVRSTCLNELERLLPIVGGDDIIPLELEVTGYQPEQLRVVIRGKDCRFLRGHGYLP
jgi:hypothetical protein